MAVTMESKGDKRECDVIQHPHPPEREHLSEVLFKLHPGM